MQDKVLRADVVDYTMQRFETELIRQLQNIEDEMDQMKRRKAELEAEIGRLTTGLASGIHSPAVMGEIARRELEVSEISNRLLSSEPNSIRMRVKALCERAMQRIQDLREYLNTDKPRTRAFLAKHVGQIVMEPCREGLRCFGEVESAGDDTHGGAEGRNCTTRATLC